MTVQRPRSPSMRFANNLDPCPWKMYRVTIDEGSEIFAARSAGAAKYAAWGAWPCDVSFVDLVGGMHVRRHDPHRGTYYNYVRDRYGLDLAHGDVIRVKERADDWWLSGKLCWVLYPNSGRCSVNAVSCLTEHEGELKSLTLHPNDVEVYDKRGRSPW